jgi:hypothetical protein
MPQLPGHLIIPWPSPPVFARAGSEYKIDASYLSPNVNMASRLEAATKQFGASILLSQDFVECLSPGVRAKVGAVGRALLAGGRAEAASCLPAGCGVTALAGGLLHARAPC